MEIIKFETTTCTPCKMVDMMLRDKGLEVDRKVNIEVDEETRDKYGVMKSPTLILVDDNGKEIDRAMGIDEEGIVELFKQAGKL
jgi:thioredoxin 1